MSESAESTMPLSDNPGRATDRARATFRERLHASWWTWPLPVIAAILLAAEANMGYPELPVWLSYVVFIPIAAGWPVWLGRIKVQVKGDELWAGDAHLPLRYIEDAEVITPVEKQRALGRELDPAAFVVHRPWVKTAVRVWLDDPEDSTPYWVISTRRATELVSVLKSS